MEGKRTLTKQDLVLIKDVFETNHVCRFDNVDKEEMDFMKDLLSVYKETRSEVIKWVVRGVIYAIGFFILIVCYFKFSR